LRNIKEIIGVLHRGASIAFEFQNKRGVMHLSASRKASRLPKRFPVGATYVVEGRGDEGGQLLVFSRYVVLPGGQRINVAADFGGPAAPRVQRSRGRKGPAQDRSKDRSKARSARAKKIVAGGGTSHQHDR
jgi:hypothetical protein